MEIDVSRALDVWGRICLMDDFRTVPEMGANNGDLDLRPFDPQQLDHPFNHRNTATCTVYDALIDGLRRNLWKDEPEAGNEAIRSFYTELKEEMRRLGLSSPRK